MKSKTETIEVELIGISANEFLEYVRQKYKASAFTLLNVSTQTLSMRVQKR